MILERQKYKAEVFKIMGFALMTPICRIVLNFAAGELNVYSLHFVSSAVFSLILFLVGIMMIQIGYEEVME